MCVDKASNLIRRIGMGVLFWAQIIYPLLEFFANNSAKAGVNSSFDAGTVLAPKNHGAPGASTIPLTGYKK